MAVNTQDSTLDRITKMAGQGLDALMNGIINKIDGALTAGVGLLGGGGETAVAEGRETGGFMQRMREAITGGFDGKEISEPAQGQKLGRSADIHNAQETPARATVQQANYVEVSHAELFDSIRAPTFDGVSAPQRSTGAGIA